MADCISKNPCKLAFIVENLRDLFSEAKPEVDAEQHCIDWLETQDDLIDSGDSLDYDGPLTWA
ncbi:MAG: hypothetical protein Tp138OMZ00d2C19078261_33 [Prokaryotic dsDNA virus sp.]|jgi:hypothetical protein|nr:MAG: hypothetical protein Tp138OMZ00d2C19078261_33 [Prokaryotic dsDNA virus sp.]|tara:strand:- start:23048 stop:23236 length:189 start_codon:yes stop_codon:yes gene_type:complete